MGAWGHGIFDDDTAYDFVDEIKADAKAFFGASFQRAIEASYLEYDDCHAVTVSAAYMDNLLHGTQYRTDSEEEDDESNVNRFGCLHAELDVDDLRAAAVLALHKVTSDASELRELWSDNEELFPKWKATLNELKSRLKKPEGAQ